MKSLAIIGAGGHGKVVADTAELLGWGDIQFFDAVWPQRESNGVWPIKGDVPALIEQLHQFDGVVVAIGNNRTRLEICGHILNAGGNLTCIIHPSAYISRHTNISAGTVIFAKAVVHPGSSIGLAAIINTAATVDHDCRIGDGVHLSPGVHLSGEVCIDDRSWIGVGAVVKQQIKIGRDVIVGAGAAVVKDIPNHLTVVGVPAKVQGVS